VSFVLLNADKELELRRNDPTAWSWYLEDRRRHTEWLTSLPAGYRDVDLATVLQTPIVEAGRRYFEEDLHLGRRQTTGGALGLFGPPGVSKTLTAVGILMAAAPVCWGRFYHAPRVARELLDFDAQTETMAELCETPLAVLDDLGAEHLRRDGMLEALFDELICFRESSRLPTVLTSNLTPELFRRRYGDRVWDRLAGPWGRIVALGGDSLRRRPAVAVST